MYYQTSRFWRISCYEMLLIQVLEMNSRLSQVYEMEILAKIVNSLKIFLKICWWEIWGLFEDIKGLFVWKFVSVIQVIQMIWKLWSLWITWIIIHKSRVIAGLVQLLGSLRSLFSHFFCVSISFAYTLWI